jgi:hypothetical protein
MDGIPSRLGPGNGGVAERDDAPEDRCELASPACETVGEGKKGSCDGDPGDSRKT